MRTVKTIVSMILAATLLVSGITIPACAGAVGADAGTRQEMSEDKTEQELPDAETDVEDKNQETEENVPFVGEPEIIIEEQLPAEADYQDTSVNAAAEESELKIWVTYDSPIKCNQETTFNLHASGGSGKYQYSIYSLMIRDGSEWVSVYDVSKGNNNAYTDSNQWKFTFCASGIYYIRFAVRDKNTNLTVNTGFYEYPLVIQDSACPSVEERVETITKQCLQECGVQASDYAKALWLHDWIVEHAVYDNELKYCSAEGVLARGAGTCVAFHRAYVMLLNKLGIQTGSITGNGHVWTAVKMDGAWYHVDTTWDSQAAKTDDYQYMYFGLNDKITGLVHSDHQSAKPGYEANNLDNNYFINTGKIKKWSDPYIEQIKQKMAEGEIEIQFSVPYNSVGNSYHYTNVIYSLVAYQLSKENWNGIKIDVSFEKAAYLVDGKLICRVGNCLTIEKNAEESVMTVRLSNAEVSSNAAITFPTWGEAGGQNDIVWYQGKKIAEGTYEAAIPISSHKESGKYNVHVYANQNGKLQFLTGGKEDITGITAGGIVWNEEKSSKEDGKYRVEVKNVSSPAGIRSVVIPVWSDANGQDDLIWYPAKKDGDVWYVDVELKKHKYGAGLYHAHAYATDMRGIYQFVGAQNFTAEKMNINQLTIKKNADESMITVRLSKAAVSSSESVTFPVWGEAGGQNDLVWYQGREIAEGTYEAKIPVSSHKETGKYNIHVYANQNGKLQFLAGGKEDITGITADGIVWNEEKSSKEDGKYRVEVKNLFSPAGIRSVEIPVWSDANGQDDLIWYPAKKDGDVWYVDVELKKHKYGAGLYNAHAYATDLRGIYQFLGGQRYTTEKMNINQLTIEKNADESVITVRLSNAAVSSNAAITFPTWGESGGQNDLVWYQGKKIAEGTYEAKIPISSHKESGKYNIHVYANQNGKSQFLTAGKENITGITADGIVWNEEKSSKEDGKYRIEVKNLFSPAGIQSVVIPVWSDANGQDDLTWYPAKKDGDVWYVDVELKKHKYGAGLYNAHAYATDSRGIYQFVEALRFSLQDSVYADISNLIKNAGKPVGKTLYVWGGGWNFADNGSGETATTIGVWPDWENYFNNNRTGYSYLTGRRAWERGERQWRFYGLDCSGYLGWVIYNSVEKGRNPAGYVTDASAIATSLVQYGYGTAETCSPGSVFKPGDIVSISGHCYLSLGQCSDGSVLLLHSTPNGGVQVSGTVNGGASSQASRLAQAFMQQNYPQWWASFGKEGKQSVNASVYLNGTKFSWAVSDQIADPEGIQAKSAEEVLNML